MVRQWNQWGYVFLFFLLFGLIGSAVYFTIQMMQVGQAAIPQKEFEPRYHFVLIPEEMDNDYWRMVEKGAQDAARDFQVFVEYTGPKKANVDEHVKTVEKAAAAKVDGIMLQGLSQTTTPLINRVVDNGIPVLTVDTDAPESKRKAYVGTDNYYAGYLAGKTLADDTGGKANVAIVTGSFDAHNQQLRVQGFKDAVSGHEDIEIIDTQESNITRIGAAIKAHKILNEYPEVNAFFGTSSLDGMGIADIVQRFHEKREMYILAFDMLPETVEFIENGVIDATIYQDPYEIGYRSVEIMLDIVQGKKVDTLNPTYTKAVQREQLKWFKLRKNQDDVP